MRSPRTPAISLAPALSTWPMGQLARGTVSQRFELQLNALSTNYLPGGGTGGKGSGKARNPRAIHDILPLDPVGLRFRHGPTRVRQWGDSGGGRKFGKYAGVSRPRWLATGGVGGGWRRDEPLPPTWREFRVWFKGWGVENRTAARLMGVPLRTLDGWLGGECPPGVLGENAWRAWRGLLSRPGAIRGAPKKGGNRLWVARRPRR